MAQDLSQAFGRPATSSLRGLLPPRGGGPRWSEPVDDELEVDETDLDEPVEPDEVEEVEDDQPEDDQPDADEPGPPPAAPPRAPRPRATARRPDAGQTTSPPAGSAPRRGVRVTSRERVDLLVLLALRRGPADGRGVISRLRETSGGVLEVPEQTVHTTLHRLARNRLLGRRLDPTSRRRRYALTEAGERAARARLREWQTLARGVDAVARHGELS